MKGKYLWGVIWAVLPSLCSCSDDVGGEMASAGGFVLSASAFEENQSRSGFDQSGRLYWSQSDVLAVENAGSGDFSPLVIDAGCAGTSVARFSGDIKGKPGRYAVYPFDGGHRINGEVLTFCIPDNRYYDKVDADFFSGTDGSGNSFNAPMYGEVVPEGNGRGSVALSHIGAVLCVKLEQLPVSSLPQDPTPVLMLRLESYASSECISGCYEVDLKGGDRSLKVRKTDLAREQCQQICFVNDKENRSGVFYFPLPTGKYTDLKLRCLDGYELFYEVEIGTLELKRRQLKKLIVPAPSGEQ